MTPALLFVEGLPRAAALERALGRSVHWAETPLDFAWALSHDEPAAILAAPNPHWALELANALPEPSRPALVGIGRPTAGAAALVDVWLDPDFGEAEARRALRLALARVRRRRGCPERVAFLDRATGLPNRRAVLRAMAHRTQLAEEQGGSLSVVLVRLDALARGAPVPDDRLRELGSLLRQATRNTELSGRLGRELFATVVWGNKSSADRAASRLERTLREDGFRATAVAQPLRHGATTPD